MPKATEDKTRPIIKEQLHSADGFLRFCNMGYIEQLYRLGITPEFLAAAELEGLIEPVFEEGEAKFYSPHHLAMVVALRNNVVKEGRLESDRQMAWGAQPLRTILWGSNLGITVEANTGKPIGSDPSPNDFPRTTQVLNSFLRMLHSFPQERYPNSPKGRSRQRLFNGAPSANFDLSDLSDATLKAYSLSIDDLVFLRKVIGGLAAQIDPLENMYEYMALHPQVRKDKLKGEALIAQEMYLTCEIIGDVIEVVTGTAPPPLMRALHEGDLIKPFLRQRQEYVSGYDTYAIKECIQKVREWIDTNKDKGLATESYPAQLTTVEARLDAFIKQYGHIYRLTGVPQEIEYNETPFNQLEPDIQQEVRRDQEAGLNFGISEEDGGGIGYMISEAIYHKLSEINRELGQVVYGIRELILTEESSAWQQDQDAGRRFTPPEERKQLWELAKTWGVVKDDFAITSQDLSLVYCSECHERPAPLHYEHHDSRVSDEPLCDICFQKVSTGALNMAPGEWQGKGGAWYCDFCRDKNGRPVLLYRFAQRNVISTMGKQQQPLRIELAYGQMLVEAKCPNPKCGIVQRKTIDWGWVD